MGGGLGVGGGLPVDVDGPNTVLQNLSVSDPLLLIKKPSWIRDSNLKITKKKTQTDIPITKNFFLTSESIKLERKLLLRIKFHIIRKYNINIRLAKITNTIQAVRQSTIKPQSLKVKHKVSQ